MGRLIAELIGNGDSAEGGLGVKDSDPNITGYGVRQFLGLSLGGLLSKSRFFRLCIDPKASEEGNRKVYATGCIPVGNEDIVRGHGSDAARRKSGNGWEVLQLLCACELLKSLGGEL